jgi:glycosyltransferase involved in cell wall biosynthesis
MATLPYFVLGPNTLLSALGLVRGSDTTIPTPPEDWRTAKVDVIIPALNEEANIPLVLASVLRQTLKPRRIMLVDDGSSDRTVEVAEAFAAAHGVDLVTIRRRKPIGKTPTIKRQACELDSDVEFILDADTMLESPNYIERTVEELYKAVGIASAFGTILPLGKKHRRAWLAAPETRGFTAADRANGESRLRGWLRDAARGATNLYREVLYLFLQRFVYHGQMVFFGTTSNPVGCAVAYRRKYVQRLFEHFTPILGDDLTNSEDIFIGLALLNEGYRNIQLTDVYARTVEPPLYKLPRQVYLWSSSFLQSCYYFDPLVKSPLRTLKRVFRRQGGPDKARPRFVPDALDTTRHGSAAFSVASVGSGAREFAAGTSARWTDEAAGVSVVSLTADVAVAAGISQTGETTDRRRIREPYRQAFGRERTLQYGRPAGWMLMMSAVEKVFFPTALLIMAILGNWHGLAWTVLLETLVGLIVLAVVMKGHRLEYVAKGLLVAPLRYALMTSELFTLGRFASDMWVTRNRKWRK